MSNNVIETIIDNFSDNYGDNVKEIVELDSNKENVFKILGLTNYEIRHSNYLKYLFLDKNFFKMFIKMYNISVDLGEYEIKREEHFEEVDEKNNKVYRYINKNKIVYSVKKTSTANITEEISENGFKFNGIVPEITEENSGNAGDSNESQYEYYKLEDDENHKMIRKTVLEKREDGFYYKDEDGSEKKYCDPEKKEAKSIGRYIDLNIIGDDYTITIENKIDSGEHDYQCIAYKNYVEKCYKEKNNHYYILLAKNDVPDFNDNANWHYPGYILIKYEDLLDILNAYKEKLKGFKKELVNQYIEIIKEWNKMPEDYKEYFRKQEINFEPFSVNENYYEIINSAKLSEDDKRFAELARQYYFELKTEYDDEISKTLTELSNNNDYFKTDYGRGKYAKCIPLKISDLNDEEKKNIKADKKRDKFFNQKKVSFQTIDYRAPREEFKSPSIAVGAGLKGDYSKELINYLKDTKFIEKADNIIHSDNFGANIYLTIKPGAGFRSNGFKQFSLKRGKWNVFSEVKNNPWISENIIGQITADDLFDAEKFAGLKSINEYFEYSSEGTLFTDTCGRFLRDKGSIINAIDEIKKFLGNEKINAQEKFDKWLEEQKHPIFKKDEEKNYIFEGGLTNIDFEFIKGTVYVSLFRKWIKGKEDLPESLKSICGILNLKELEESELDNGLKKYIKEILQNKPHNGAEDDEIDENGDKNNVKKNKTKTILDKVAEKLDVRSCKRINVIWEMSVFYELTVTDWKENREKTFYEKTIKCVGLFDNNKIRYSDFFTDYVFKPEFKTKYFGDL